MIFETTCLRFRRNIVYLLCSVLTGVAILSKPTEYLLQRMNLPSRDGTVLRLTKEQLTVRHET